MLDSHQPALTHSRVLVRRIYSDQLLGPIARYLNVGPGQQAVVTRKGQSEALPPGRHRLAWLWGSAPDDIVLVEAQAFTLHPAVGSLLSGDGAAVQGDAIVGVQVSDARRLAQALGDHERLTTGDLEGRLAADMQPFLAAAARKYAAADLYTSQMVNDAIASELRSVVVSCLDGFGLFVQQIKPVVFCSAEDAAIRVEAMAKLRDRMRQTATSERLADVKSDKDAWDAVQQIEQEYKIRDLVRQDELEGMRADLTPSQPTLGAADIARLLDEKLDDQRQQMTARFEEMLKKLGPNEPAQAQQSLTVRNLRRVARLLQATCALAVSGTTLLAVVMPDIFADPQAPRIITGVAGVLLALLSFASVMYVEHRISDQRRTEQLLLDGERLSPERRKNAERMVRAQVAGDLQQLETNLAEAWPRAYRNGLQDLSTRLRQLTKKVGETRDDLRAASYESATLLNSRTIADADFEALLNVDGIFLQQAHNLADSSLALHHSVVSEQRADVTHGADQLENGLQDLRSTMIKRSALIKGA